MLKCTEAAQIMVRSGPNNQPCRIWNGTGIQAMKFDLMVSIVVHPSRNKQSPVYRSSSDSYGKKTCYKPVTYESVEIELMEIGRPPIPKPCAQELGFVPFQFQRRNRQTPPLHPTIRYWKLNTIQKKMTTVLTNPFSWFYHPGFHIRRWSWLTALSTKTATSRHISYYHVSTDIGTRLTWGSKLHSIVVGLRNRTSSLYQ